MNQHCDEQKEKIMKKGEQNLRDLQGTIKLTSIHVIGVLGKKEKIKEMMAKNISILMKNMNLHIQVSQQTPSRINLKKRSIRRHVIIKL